MHDRSMYGRTGLVPARAQALISACVSMMVGCHPAYAQQSSQASSVFLTADPSRTPAATPPRATKVGFVDGLRQPESVLYDPVRDVFYISNMDGAPATKDGTGFITRLRADGTVEDLRWIDGGRNGVTLDAPRGMAIIGDVLWIADIDVVRAFDAQSGAPLTQIDLAPLGARFLKDVTAGPDRMVYVTATVLPADAGAGDPTARNRIFRVELGGRASVVLNFERLKQPNGIVWDRFNHRFLITPIGSDTAWTWRPGSDAFSPLTKAPGQYDVFVTLLEDAGDVADIEWDAKRELLYVPLTAQNRVDIFRIPKQ